MAYDFSRVAFGCIRDPARPKAFRGPGVSVSPLPVAWARNSWPIVLGHNDTLGTCVPTAACNAVMAHKWNGGVRDVIPNSLPVEIYSTVGPYRGTPETDIGMDPVVLFNWWLHNSIAGYRLRSWSDIDPSDEAAMRHAIVSGESVFVTQQINAPQETQSIWRPDGGAEVGLHATSYDRFDGDLSWCACWGDDQGVDQAFIAGPAAQVLDVYALDIVPL